VFHKLIEYIAPTDASGISGCCEVLGPVRAVLTQAPGSEGNGCGRDCLEIHNAPRIQVGFQLRKMEEDLFRVLLGRDGVGFPEQDEWRLGSFL
jgi:hypothetical protein